MQIHVAQAQLSGTFNLGARVTADGREGASNQPGPDTPERSTAEVISVNCELLSQVHPQLIQHDGTSLQTHSEKQTLGLGMRARCSLQKGKSMPYFPKCFSAL